MKKFIVRFSILFSITIFVLGFIKVSPIVASGYEMYKQVTTEKSIEDVIEEIKSKESYVKLEDIPHNYIKVLLKTEDKRFYYHIGFDPIAISRATYNNLKLGYFAQGGSTITQQLAKNMYFSFEKRMERKVAELFVAHELENTLSKNEILELYCNITYFGEGCYGLKEASNHYYSVNPNELSLAESTALVITLKSPNNYNPNALREKGL